MVKLPKRLQDKKERWLYKMWNEEKSDLRMWELAEIWGIALGTAHNYLKKEYERNK